MKTNGRMRFFIRSAVAGCALAVSLITGCVKTTTIRSSSTAATARIPETSLANVAHIPAGTRFVAQLVAPIDSRTSQVNDAFEALLIEPLRDARGNVVGLPGMHVIGRVAELSSGRYPMINLVFDGIRTTAGFRPLSVAVEDAQRSYYNGPDREVLPPRGPEFGTAVYGNTYGMPFSEAYGDVNGGITTPESYVGRPREVRLERGAQLSLRLTRPLVLQ